MNFSIDLIHRDSPLSPLYNSSVTPYELMREAALRSYSRAKFLHSSMHIDNKLYVSSLDEYNGQYFIVIYIGSPSVAFHVIADIGSNLIWVQCSRDNKPLHFNPLTSSTYDDNISSNSEFCKALRNSDNGDSNTCKYDHSYSDGSHTSGILSKETFHLNLSSNDGSHSFPGVVFGCSKEQYIYGGNGQFQGIVGLGPGLLSLVCQLKYKIESKFSYCLVPFGSKKANKLIFGAGETISGVEIVSTPLILRTPPKHYYLSLESISIGEKKAIANLRRRTIIIDSGTSLTMLHSSLYNSLEAIVKTEIDANPIPDPPKQFRLCYKFQSIRVESLPEMVFNFDGADIRLLYYHTFRKFPGDIICMVIVPNDSLSIFGSFAQVNFLVEFDLQNRKVFFAKKDCTVM